MRAGLIWRLGPGELSWQEAMAYAASLEDGWRLPTVHELLELVDYSQAPALRCPLLSVAYGDIWTAQSRAGLPSLAYAVEIETGHVCSQSKALRAYVLCCKDT